jgi:hypothetical protein
MVPETTVLRLALALGSGLLMDGDALENGQLRGVAYELHLLAWLFLTLALLAHLAGALRRGGWPLISSMLSLRLQARDRPQHWPGQLGLWLGRWLGRGGPKP